MDSLKNFVSDDFGKAIFTVAGTLLVTGFGVWLGAFKELFTDWWRRRRQARYHAMLLAVTLDQLVDDCMTAAFDDGIADQEGERVTTSANPAIVWPDALDWPLLNTEVMYRCLLLPGMVKSALESLAFISENIAGPPDYEEYFDERQLRYAAIGLSAFHLLERIKGDYGLIFESRRKGDLRKSFEQKIEEIELDREEARISRQRLQDEIALRDSDGRYDRALGPLQID